MRLSSIALVFGTFLIGAVLCLVTALFAVNVIQDNSERGVRRALDLAALHWAEVEADGLRVYLAGTAPSEALRFQALSTAGAVVDAARIIDQMEVEETKQMAPPRFSIEILRNDGGISLIGLVPSATDREALAARLGKLTEDGSVADLLESADYATPDGWDTAVDYAVSALQRLKRAKVSVSAQQVEITAISNSPNAKRSLESELSSSAPRGLRLSLNISAPRPVITPFTLRFLIEDGTPRFDACSADTEEARNRILSAATSAGLTGKAACTIGLGVPTPNWAAAAEQAIAALARLGGGSVTFSDADVTLVAAEGTEPDLFDRTVGELENSLPDVFALHAVLPEPKDDKATGPPEFLATLSPEGLLQLRGRLSDELSRTTTESFARARFGSGNIYVGARLDDSLPADWPVRVLTGLEALSKLSNGALIVQPDTIRVSGNTGNTEASAEIARLLAEKLGEAERFDIDVTYQEKLDPVASIPTPEECEAEIAAILDTRKINFEPGSSTPDSAARGTIDDIAEILKTCGEVRMEIGGHTDSQGREVMNQQLSQARAQAVLNALRERRVLTANITAKGYGEETPIADNDTEEGREANRRIEFKLIRPEPTDEEQTTLESVEQSNVEDTDAEAPSEQGSSDE
ncbi:OmpA family protein [Lutimaribacter sp. EGI FJ00015]|uniref:OmpA family protein n=1 Tax=Lutimaribacter degradans TaxID=2945989 RepID=A0ACC5ZXL1_9RHOB|nr:OmpA family protein [Lutimaribacter sp. EGI FJ00013]MCM2562933.1 OmpA family protein [Lutimaribacter sp. EGI FJ00013]MCO0614101.1 OmpA family protein [Lutimaribacter sp. EGI FJ00015]MCO0636078.1 OmpA family protein [Lutimaribacter sp. EGI FJ00014]